MTTQSATRPADAASHEQAGTAPSPGGESTVPFAEIAPLMDLADMMAPVAVRVAATLRLADHIAAGVTTTADLAVTVDANPDTLHRLLRYLAARDVFAPASGSSWELTDLARLLLDDHPAALRTRFDLDGPVGRGDLSFIHLLHSIRTGGPAFGRMYGRSFWEDVDADPARVADFARMMSANVRDSGLAEAFDFSDVHHVVDVGGGDGTLLRELLDAHPHLRGTVVDKPTTVERARTQLAAAGLDDRADVVGGDFFADLPADGDVYLLCKVLHDWGDSEAKEILGRCARAAGPHGRVLIVEAEPRAGANRRGFTYLDLHMLVYFGGKERTLQQFRDLAAASGLEVEHRGTAKWGQAVLECRPQTEREDGEPADRRA